MAEIKKIGVLGAGQMGAGIAQVCAMSGFQSVLWDSSPSAMEKGLKVIDASLAKGIEKGKLQQSQADSARKNLTKGGSIKDFSDCDLVIEAIIEDLDIKLSAIKDIDSVLKPEGLIASNTSSISITRLAAGTKRPDKIIGMHFMNPVPIMKLVEIIRGLQTSDQTYEAVNSCSEKLGKTTVLAIDGPGFVVNRILVPMINEAIFVLQEGVKPQDIDNAMKLGTNQPMGPLELADFVGLDTLLAILRILHDGLGEDKYRPCPLLIKYVEAGWYGRKSGRGFYQY